MDFDLSKENIQPLRNGRNVAQLGVALQAQTNEDYQRQLMQQKQVYENTIRNYVGDDPLDNWYNYISWVEQSFPRSGHQGNLLILIEECLSLFEDDPRYKDDRRFCKLWIKYFDFQTNPLELYQMMYARRICVGCADLYKAWAYYHEAAGDFKMANTVLEYGLREFAQPHGELLIAKQNVLMTAGQHLISGTDERQLSERRHALTSLSTYRHGRVGSVRVPSSSTAGISQSAGTSLPRSNVSVSVYQSNDENFHVAGAAAPTSILRAVRRHEPVKENTMKPGVWTAPINKQSVGVHKVPSFTVHVDDENSPYTAGLRLPSTFSPANHDDFSDLVVPLFLDEPTDPAKIPVYPKSLVYGTPNAELSLEEIRAQRYLRPKPSDRLNVPLAETQQAIQSILGNAEDDEVIIVGDVGESRENVDGVRGSVLRRQLVGDFRQSPAMQTSVCRQESQGDFVMQENQADFRQFPAVQASVSHQEFQQLPATHASAHEQHFEMPRPAGGFARPSQDAGEPRPERTPVKVNLFSPQANKSGETFKFGIWSSPGEESCTTVNLPAKKNFIRFEVFEESPDAPRETNRPPPDSRFTPRGSAMKTPFKVISADDLAETGSRGGLDAVAQPSDGAKRLPVFEDDDEDEEGAEEFNTSCNTQMFSFNLNAMKVSTPQKQTTAVEVKQQQGFGKESLSTILEESKSYGSSSSGSTAPKSTILQSKAGQMSAISEEHNSYLAENLMANAALRSTLFGDLMDCDARHTAPKEPPPVVVQPRSFHGALPTLTQVPSDPFQPAVIDVLLNKVGFPGRHTRGFQIIHNLPRLAVRKEISHIGNENYLVDKQLGKGTYGTVFRAVECVTNRLVALKFQKPANRWEYYICRELQERLSQHQLRDRFMDIQIGYFHEQASILVSDFCPCGSLLDVRNAIKQKTGQNMKQSLCIYFCIEMLNIMSAMHSARVIHADVKPDNFLVFLGADETVRLQLIDFGCAIDMSLYPPGATFTRAVTTENFVCCEMRDGRPWSYHTDLFCVAATAHVLLFHRYIEVQKKGNLWSITQRLPRYLHQGLWNKFFNSLLNQKLEPAETDSLTVQLRNALEDESGFQRDMRLLVNLLKDR